jgi:hypothetical protein
MRIIFSLALLACLCAACNNKQPGSFEEAFILSLQKNDFTVIKSYLPDKDFYLSLGEKMPKRSDEEIQKFLDESNERIKEAWQNTLLNVAEKKMDLSRLKIREVILHDPFPRDETSEAMVVDYEYNGQVWDDLQFIIARQKGKTYLLGIPNPTRSFSMTDTELRATNEAKAWVEMQKPEFKKELEELTAKLIKAAKENKLDEFGGHLVYRGADETKQWRTAINMNDTTERKLAEEFMQRVSHTVEPCTNYETGTIMTERESEGVWIVLPLKCSGRVVSFAYLRINGRLFLGDTEIAPLEQN